MRKFLVALVLLLEFCGCNAGPQTKADHLWYWEFAAQQSIGGSCSRQVQAYALYLQDVVGVDPARMRFISSRDIRTGGDHLRLQVYMRKARAWRTFDPGLNAFNYAEGGWGCPYAWHETLNVYPGDRAGRILGADDLWRTEIPEGGTAAK